MDKFKKVSFGVMLCAMVGQVAYVKFGPHAGKHAGKAEEFIGTNMKTIAAFFRGNII